MENRGRVKPSVGSNPTLAAAPYQAFRRSDADAVATACVSESPARRFRAARNDSQAGAMPRRAARVTELPHRCALTPAAPAPAPASPATPPQDRTERKSVV